MDIATVNVKAVDISDDGKKVSLTFSEMVPGYVYDLTIQNLKSKSKKGVKLINKRLFYTANNIL